MTPHTLRPTVRRRTSIAAAMIVVVAITASCGSDDAADDSSATTLSSADTADATDAPDPTDAPETTEADSDTISSTDETEATDDRAVEAELWTATAPNMTPVDDATADEWQQMAEDALAAAPGTPGAIIAISDPERGYWTAAIGDAEVDVDPMTLDHHGRIGSITKTFTAVAVLEQVDQGNMSLDDTVAEIVPDIATEFPATADLTVEDLLTMTSGLPDYANVPGAATAQAVEDPTKVWTAEELIAAALDASEVEPVGTPGYSTTNFAILGLMYEAVTGETIEDGVTRVAAEVGLTDTALLPGDQNEMPDPSTHGYVDEAAVPQIEGLSGVEVPAGTDTTDWSLSWGGAGGGAYSTISDLFQWASTGSGNVLLSTELGDERIATDNELTAEQFSYGLGAMSIYPGWVGHTGQAIGWEALGMYEPDTGATIAVLVNSTAGLQGFYTMWTDVFGIETGAAVDTTADAEDASDLAFIVGTDVFFAQITDCAWDGSMLTLSAEGDEVEIDATTGDDGTVEITVAGSSEVTASGTVADEDGTLVFTGTTTDDTSADTTLAFESTLCS